MHEKLTISNSSFITCGNSDIYISSNSHKKLFQIINGKLNPSKIFIITDNNIQNLYLDVFYSNLKQNYDEVHVINFEGGEKSKDLAIASKIINEILNFQPDRKSLIIALGGGVVGDITGFVASVILRGISYIQIPTTFMAQIDSSIGGKTGVNSKFGKNLIGSFYLPKFIIIDPLLLKTLPEKEFLSGYVEVIKYCIINNYNMFEYLESSVNKIIERDITVLSKIIEFSVKCKSDIVNSDPNELTGNRISLNLGHSFGHAIESYCMEKEYSVTHGEAVALGIILAYKFSIKHAYTKNLCHLERIQNHFKRMGISTSMQDIITERLDVERMLTYMMYDKKNHNGTITLVLPKEIGKVSIAKGILEENMKIFLKNQY